VQLLQHLNAIHKIFLLPFFGLLLTRTHCCLERLFQILPSAISTTALALHPYRLIAILTSLFCSCLRSPLSPTNRS
jgi:hypothetical protein